MKATRDDLPYFIILRNKEKLQVVLRAFFMPLHQQLKNILISANDEVLRDKHDQHRTNSDL